MYVLDRPLLPKYTRAKFDSDLTSSSTTSRSSSGISSHNGAPSTASTRIGSYSQGRPYSTTDRRSSICSTSSGRPGSTTSRRSVVTASGHVVKGPRIKSADSGIDEEDAMPDAKYILPPRITSYCE